MTEHEGWDDPKLEALLGQGTTAFRQTFDSLPDGAGVLWAIRDDRGRILDFEFGYGNPTMLAMYQLTTHLRGRFTVTEAFPLILEDGTFGHLIEVCETGIPYVDEVALDAQFGDGWVRGVFIRRMVKLGEGLLVFQTDITRQRRMEEELRRYADVVAHDLREPVMALSQVVAMIERQPDQPPHPRQLQLLRAGIARARELIDGVLAYARAGELRRDTVDLAQLVEEVREDLAPRLEAASAELEVGPLPAVSGDARQLRRLLQNLVANGVKFSDVQAPRVEVSAREGDLNWVVTVRDNGIGVPEEDTARIFGMFSRGVEDREGSGIGLAVCRRVVEAHGGRIWVEPAEGGGSAFRFTLPR